MAANNQTLPDEASLEFNVRPVPEYDNDFIESFFQNIINDVDSNKLSLDIPSNHRPVTSDKNSKLITTIKDVASSSSRTRRNICFSACRCNRCL